jgi:hypothetical protein
LIVIAVVILVMHHSNSSAMSAVSAAVAIAKCMSMAACSTLPTFSERGNAFAIQSNMRPQSFRPGSKAKTAWQASYVIRDVASVRAVPIAAGLLAVVSWP